MHEQLLAFLRTSGLPSRNPMRRQPARSRYRRWNCQSGRQHSGLGVCAGQSRKRLSTVERVLDALAAAGVERGALVLGIGGGVASDLFGFACAIYMRGIRYEHVATSLVAMVDAAIGGKTGVDLRKARTSRVAFAIPSPFFAARTRWQRSPPARCERASPRS